MGDGLIEYVKKGVICKRTQKFEMLKRESVCSELTIAKKKWHCLGIYWLPKPENVVFLFEELTDSFTKGREFYENFIILGDSNIDIKVPGRELDEVD